jgi:hypothetical protein
VSFIKLTAGAGYSVYYSVDKILLIAPSFRWWFGGAIEGSNITTTDGTRFVLETPDQIMAMLQSH